MLTTRIVACVLPAVLATSSVTAAQTRADSALRRVEQSIVISSRSTSHDEAAIQRVGMLRQNVIAEETQRLLAKSSGEPFTRRIIGRVVDDSTGIPIANAAVYLVGVQPMGGPRHKCVSRRGEFQFDVTDDKVSLDATAPNYEFAQLSLLPFDTVAVLRGRRTMRPSERIARGHLTVAPSLSADEAFASATARSGRRLVLLCD